MGSGIAPKTFPPATPFGAAPNPVITPSQSVPLISGPGFAAMPSNPDQSPPSPQDSPVNGFQGFGGGGDVEQLRKRIQDQRGNYGATPMPFFG